MCGKHLFVGPKKHIAAMQSDVSTTANVVLMGHAWTYEVGRSFVIMTATPHTNFASIALLKS